MKKLSLVVLGAIAFAGVAHAQYTETVVTETVSVAQPVSSVAQVLNMADNTNVIMTGNVVKPLGNDMYLFRDPTGTISVEIEDSDWRGLEVTEFDTVRIRGNVDRGTPGIMVEVDYIDKI